MKNHDPQLIVSESFYSIQGEGKTAGTPAVFLRLSGCNLNCEFCDTKVAWNVGEQYSLSQIIKKWQEHGWLEKLQNGAHLVITGGEPVLQQDVLLLFIQQLDAIIKPYIELETNATILLNKQLIKRINQINASPKLSSSTNAKLAAYRLEVLQQLAKEPKTKFKFVITSPADMQEILEQYIKPFKIEPHQVWLMPEGTTQQALQGKAILVVELCQKYAMNFSPRLQISLDFK